MTQSKKHLLFLVVLGSVFFLPFLGYVHLFDWDEINFAESAREMLETGNYFQVQIDYEPFWEKPPFFFWLQVASMKIFGITEFAARLPNALLGILSLIVLYFIGKKLVSEKFGLIWSLIYLASLLPHLYFKSGIIDPYFNFFIFLSIYFLILTLKKATRKKRNALASGLFIGLAIITKGPVALLLLILTFILYIIIKKGKVKIPIICVFIFFISSLSVTFIWFGYETMTNSPWFILEFINYQIELLTKPVAGHEQPFYYHFVVILIGCFPMSIIALPSFKNRLQEIPFDFTLWMKILFWVVLLLFTIVKTKIVHYSSMCYLPLSFLATLVLYSSTNTVSFKLKKSMKYIVFCIGIIFGILLTLVPILFKYNKLIQPYIKDEFVLASFNINMNWSGLEFLVGLLFLVGLIISFRFLLKNETLNFAKSIAISSGMVLLLYSMFIVPKIEKFSQGATIAFYKSIQNEDAYVTTIGFKSYAHLFYTKKKKPEENCGLMKIKENYKKSLKNPKDFDAVDLNNKVRNWLLGEKIDKKAYFVAKLKDRDYLIKNKDLIYIKNVGGFDFYYKNP